MLDCLALEPLAHADSPFEKVTVSIGVASARGCDLDNSEALLARADQALYVAKEAGRNRLHIG